MTSLETSVNRTTQEPAATNTPLACRVLLVEDIADNQRLISFLLRKQGAEVAIAENGLVGMERALVAAQQGEPFDIVLMDMQMPVLDGYEATRNLRSQGYERPIVALTAHALAGDREKCLAAGCNDYLSKPVDRALLVAMIRSHINP